MVSLKRRLLEMLREADVYILERGAIDQYYPNTIVGADKPSRALDFFSKVDKREAILACCGEQTVTQTGEQKSIKEFELIFKGIFGSMNMINVYASAPNNSM